MIVVVCGPGGVGKGTVARRLIHVVEDLELSRSWTSRERRPHETDEDYVFVSRRDFEEAAARGVFLEWAEFNGNLYGTPGLDPKSTKDLLLEIDAQGAVSVRSLEPSALIVLLLPPTTGELSRRMASRGDNEEQIQARVQLAHDEVVLARTVRDVEVVNADLDEAVSAIASSIREARTSRSQ